MFLTLKRLVEWVMLVIIFFLITLFLYDLFNIIGQLLSPINEYKEPLGKSIKVTDMGGNELNNADQFIQRLKLFYWIGE